MSQSKGGGKIPNLPAQPTPRSNKRRPTGFKLSDGGAQIAKGVEGEKKLPSPAQQERLLAIALKKLQGTTPVPDEVSNDPLFNYREADGSPYGDDDEEPDDPPHPLGGAGGSSS